jgi:hypothetical protein
MSSTGRRSALLRKRHGRNRVDCYETLVAAGEVAIKEIAKGEIELF